MSICIGLMSCEAWCNGYFVIITKSFVATDLIVCLGKYASSDFLCVTLEHYALLHSHSNYDVLLYTRRPEGFGFFV